MPTENPNSTITELLRQLEVAVRSADQARAFDLERQILQCLLREHHEHVTVEHRVRALLAEMNTPATATPLDVSEPLALERSDVYAGEGVVYPVWFGTNRKRNSTDDGFSNDRGAQLLRGRVEVFVPEAHRFGETGNAFLKRLLRFDLRDDRLRIQNMETLERAAFFNDIRGILNCARDLNEPGHALFYLHGFNVTFDEAAIRAAQIGFDLKVPGATAFFSWPSRGSVTAYMVDEATIEASERALTEFLADFVEQCGAEKIHILAHSMGNRGLLRALQRIAADSSARGKIKFGQILLAAPDVDRDLFLDLANLYREHAERTTLYTSRWDRPVHCSAKLHDSPRAGYFEPYTVAPGVDTIAVPRFDIDLLGHSYFAQAEALLHDIHDVMRHGKAPNHRQRIGAASRNGSDFWELKR